MHRATTVLLSGALTAATLTACGNGGEAMPCSSIPPVEASQLNLSPDLPEARRLSQIELATMAARIACLAQREQDSTTVSVDFVTMIDVAAPVDTGDKSARHAVVGHLEVVSPAVADKIITSGKIDDFSQVYTAATYRRQYPADANYRNPMVINRTPPLELALFQSFHNRQEVRGGREGQNPSDGDHAFIRDFGQADYSVYSSGIIFDGQPFETGNPDITIAVVQQAAAKGLSMLKEAEA